MKLKLHMPCARSTVEISVVGGYRERSCDTESDPILVAETITNPAIELTYRIIGDQAVHLGRIDLEVKREFEDCMCGDAWNLDGRKFRRMTAAEVVDLAYGKTFTFRHRSEIEETGPQIGHCGPSL